MKTFSMKVKDRLWVHHEGKIFSMPLVPKRAGAGAAGEDSIDELVAPFSCKVVKIFVKPGQAVKKGEPVVLVEAMKMEYSYPSPRDGTIAAVNVKAGATVAQGTEFVTWKK